MGRHQQAEASGIISFMACATLAWIAMDLYLQFAPAIWRVTQRLFTVCAGITAGCGVISFTLGYACNSRSMTLKHGWTIPIRRIFEILALSVVYASTIFVTAFMLLSIASNMMGLRTLKGYLTALCAAISGVVGYVTFVQAELMNAKTIASLLPFFVVSGVSIAGLTSDDPYWYNNNFSQLGDRTTFAARMFNSTLMLAGVCIVIISYFAISELITTHRLQMQYLSANDEKEAPKHFKARILLLSTMLTLAGIAFIGIGMFRYTPHPILHNVFARGLPCLMSVLMIALPWLAPQLSKVVYVISDLAIVIGALAGFQWLAGRNTLTNVEALAGMMFLGWFIIFSRQIAAIESDRVQTQLILAQTKRPESVEDLAEVSETVPGTVSRLSSEV
ncbi:ABC transporter permease [Bifidobacterium adolescentis]|uniref:ABC transporter permease n=1 Tax=Bifidobacterium adolescentis TaxID=1680 RepID=UPI000E47F432|nr:ABC transporter permease [Bifidobacterium adolescentis]MDB0582175.1 ABC transporter permease [Bifidobacterium adolescentis]MDB0596341.1 ABC transporter permease [Bifidobacterium adolescentis]MDB0605457.1 ABC transporter permease [Bifidobacterium adolescentis]MDB0609618.1 ABC transporter permease [Bifidobacterium adolescentis]MDB0623906.1 ABC transporter permease [Bifidobacterium adolescentis]